MIDVVVVAVAVGMLAKRLGIWMLAWHHARSGPSIEWAVQSFNVSV